MCSLKALNNNSHIKKFKRFTTLNLALIRISSVHDKANNKNITPRQTLIISSFIYTQPVHFQNAKKRVKKPHETKFCLLPSSQTRLYLCSQNSPHVNKEIIKVPFYVHTYFYLDESFKMYLSRTVSVAHENFR